MNPKNRRLRRSVAAAGSSLLGIGVAASYLFLGASAPAQAAGTHIIQVNLTTDAVSVLVQEVTSADYPSSFCWDGPAPKGWLNTNYPVADGTKVKVTAFDSPHCKDRLLQVWEGTVPGDDGQTYYWLQQ